MNALMGSVGTPKVQPWSFLSSFLPVALLPELTPSQGIRCPFGQYSPPDSDHLLKDMFLSVSRF